jgi:hypothetical protein
VEQTLEEMRAVAIHDAMAIAELQRECDPTPLVLVPRFERDVHDLATLWETSRYLVGDVRVPAGAPVEEAATSRAP